MENREIPQGPEQVLSREGFRNVSLMKRRGEGGVYAAEHEGEDVVIKVGRRTEHGIDLVENQQRADAFLSDKLPGDKVFVPASTLLLRDGWTMAISAKVSGEVLAESVPDGMRSTLSSDEIKALVESLVAIRGISVEDMPKYFRQIAESGWNKDFYAGRLLANAQNPIDKGLMTVRDRDGLREIWESHFEVASFQHHDIVPFNLMRSEDGRLALLDGEYARVGMTGYDPAYFVLQSAGLLHQPKMAHEFLVNTLEAWDKQYPQSDLRKAIMSPLAYRVIANLGDAGAMTNAGVQERAKALKDAILTDDIARVMEALEAMA
ncbi:phosphotransferase [Patescibacteria group bacterium]|nr:phosphotransferase [Patescibacteria group bacterium]